MVNLLILFFTISFGYSVNLYDSIHDCVLNDKQLGKNEAINIIAENYIIKEELNINTGKKSLSKKFLFKIFCDISQIAFSDNFQYSEFSIEQRKIQRNEVFDKIDRQLKSLLSTDEEILRLSSLRKILELDKFQEENKEVKEFNLKEEGEKKLSQIENASESILLIKNSCWSLECILVPQIYISLVENLSKGLSLEDAVEQSDIEESSFNAAHFSNWIALMTQKRALVKSIIS